MNEQNSAPKEKATYEQPRLERLGTFEELTQGGGTGDYTDAAFPRHTPKSSLTFS